VNNCARDLPTLPSTIEQEGPVDPFPRTRRPGVIRPAHEFNGATCGDEVAVFAAIRPWKNEFR
jgi:hydroxyacylglutathione hydrolase